MSPIAGWDNRIFVGRDDKSNSWRDDESNCCGMERQVELLGGMVRLIVGWDGMISLEFWPTFGKDGNPLLSSRKGRADEKSHNTNGNKKLAHRAGRADKNKALLLDKKIARYLGTGRKKKGDGTLEHWNPITRKNPLCTIESATCNIDLVLSSRYVDR